MGPLQDGLGGPVVLLHRHEPGLRVVALEGQDVAEVGVAPGIDGLVGVADHGDVAMLLGQQPGYGVLDDVGVLELVDEQMQVASLVVLGGIGKVRQQLMGLHQQVVKIHGLGEAQPGLVAAIDPGDDLFIVRADAGGELLGVLHLALGAGDGGEDGPGRVSARVQVQVQEGLLHQGHLVFVVVDVEVAVQPKMHPVAAQDGGAPGVERAEGKLGGSRAQQLVEPLSHLLGRLVRERHGHDAPGVDAHFPDQIGDAVGDDPRLAGTGPGEDQQRPLDVLGGFPLLGIEAGEEVPGWRCGHEGIISGQPLSLVS